MKAKTFFSLIKYGKEASPAAYSESFLNVSSVSRVSGIKSQVDDHGGSGAGQGSSKRRDSERKSGFGSILDEQCTKVTDDIQVRTTGYGRSGRPVNVNVYLHEYRK